MLNGLFLIAPIGIDQGDFVMDLRTVGLDFLESSELYVVRAM